MAICRVLHVPQDCRDPHDKVTLYMFEEADESNKTTNVMITFFTTALT